MMEGSAEQRKKAACLRRGQGSRLWIGVTQKRNTLVIAALSLLLSGCLFAEQSGEVLPHEVYQSKEKALGELSFHFRTITNYIFLLARAALFAGAAYLLRREWRASRRQLPILAVLGALSLGAAWFVGTAAVRVVSYKVAVDDSGLKIHIPFQVDIDEPWSEVVGANVEGKEWREGSDRLYTEWSKMEVLLSEGRRVSVDLSALGVVERSSFMKAFVHRSKMSEFELPYPIHFDDVR